MLSVSTRHRSMVLMPFESRFGNCADAFHHYRPDYPPALYVRIFADIPGDSLKCAMDLGAGTGIVIGHLVPRFRDVIAVEPDGAMVTILVGQFPRVSVRQTTAEECEQPPGTVNLITIANALHWMDAERVFANAHNWLRRAGILAVFDRPLPKASAEIDAITMAEFRGPWKPHRDPRLKRDLTWKDKTRTALGFRVIEEADFPNVLPMSPADYVGFWKSTSYGSAYARTLAKPENYWSALECRLADASRGNPIPVDLSSTLLLLRKRP